MFTTLLLTIIWGIVIGILVSAPMGPTGILVIQRTLNRGWLPGFLTGIGAAVSDLFYAIVAVLGVAFIVDWIQAYQTPLQIVGSVCIAFYGLYLWMSNPASSLTTSDKLSSTNTRRVGGWLKFFFSGIGLTIINPSILFFYFVLFARTNFLFDADAEHWWLYPIGFGGIVSGALGWWVLITWAINKVRNHFKLRTLRIINRSIAILIYTIAAFGFVTGVYAYFTQ